ncbi:uncharacterized protein LOC105444985 [Strongylocentrotus purpuratus]|uniref:Ig-like domain-containing protein n=1 Tax=Strongylocentrotus purpuratus TaxID=7668 RepID=A0A7M7NB96_STRPU|nr:uncharacterized protein LOC105444985 [Strongylocentrotus purpuratus]
MVTFEFPGTSLRVSCDIVGADQPVPLPRNYSIFSDGTEIPKSSTGINFVVVPDTDFDLETEFYCQASNYLGIATSQTTIPTRTTAPPPTTALETATSKVGNKTGSGGTGGDGANVAAIAGGVVGAIVVIVIIVIAVCYCKKEERFCFEAGGFSFQALFSSCKCSLPPKSSGSSKPAGSAVGSSNGSERDVESPLNGVKDVTAEEKTKPEAAPRGHGSIQHTNDNPNQDMYAMVDKKPSGGRGGDAPDRGSGPGQNEPQGMLYADLDLSHKAGHTDKHVPKNENDVVVYSSILV